MRSANLAIVFVDIAGFTARTGQQSRAESQAWLARYEELLLPLIKAFGGQRIKSIGDAFLCTFASPTNALLFGMAAQDRLYSYNLDVAEDERIRIRVAVNAGEVRLERRDIFGEPVNIAARVEGLAPVGEIWFTEAVYLAMTRSEVPAEEVGLRELKGIAEPVKLYRVCPSSQYKLEASGAGVPPTEDPSTEAPENTLHKDYPYGGLGLKRLDDLGANLALADLQAKLRRGGRGLWNRLDAKVLKGVGYGAAALMGLLLLVLLWPNDPFSDLQDLIDSGQPAQALSLLKTHPEADSPRGKLLRAHALLGLPDPDIDEAAGLIEEAIAKDPSLKTVGTAAEDMVACLDKQRNQKRVDFILQHFGDQAEDALIKGTSDKRYWLRWNSLAALKAMDQLDEVDLGQVYLQDLLYAGSCSTRKRAAEKLIEMKDPRALEALRQTKKRGMLPNLCMGSTLDEGIKTLEAL